MIGTWDLQVSKQPLRHHRIAPYNFNSFSFQITDSQDKFINGNISGEKVLGFPQSELIDKNLWDLQSPVGLSEMVLAENDSVSLDCIILDQIIFICSSMLGFRI